MILVNGTVFTGVDSRPYAQAIAIKGSRISAVGTNLEISYLASPKTRRIDAGGRLVIPGINDSHVHFDEPPKAISVDFGDPDVMCSQVLDRLSQIVRRAPAGALLAGAINLTAFFDPSCNAPAFDNVAPKNAVVLWTPTLHAAILNNMATRRFKVRVDDPPALGGWFGKNMLSAHWDGVVHEYSWFQIFESLPSDLPAAEAAVRRFLDREARWGVTSITLIELKPAHRLAMLARANAGLRIRLVPSPLTEKGRRLIPESPAVPARLADRISISGVKWWLDGSPFERSCAMREPFQDQPSTSGQINFSPEEIHTILEEARQKNTQLILHTVGDRTAETLLRVMETTGGADIWPQQRLRIEHGDGLAPDLIPRAKKLDAIVVQNPTHLDAGDLVVRRFGPNRAAIESPLASLLAAGVPVVLASDGAAGEPELNPYLNIGLASNYPAKPRESLTREQALIAYTRTAAYAEFSEANKGTLEPGKLADLAVLSQNIFGVAPDELSKTESVLTMVGGKILYTNSALFKSPVKVWPAKARTR
jgi:predicted amidohydrolase YtcJ